MPVHYIECMTLEKEEEEEEKDKFK